MADASTVCGGKEVKEQNPNASPLGSSSFLHGRNVLNSAQLLQNTIYVLIYLVYYTVSLDLFFF